MGEKLKDVCQWGDWIGSERPKVIWKAGQRTCSQKGCQYEYVKRVRIIFFED